MGNFNRRDFISEIGTGILEEKLNPKEGYVDPSNKELPLKLSKAGSGITEYTGTFSDDHLWHLLRRTLPGVSLSDFNFFKSKSLTDAVDYLLNVSATPPSPPLNTYSYNTAFADPDVPVGTTWVNAPASSTLEFVRRQSLKAWWMGLYIGHDRTIREKMTLFWHNHFSTEMNSVIDSRYLYKHHSTLRAGCLGNFKTLVKQITLDPAMLSYLNGEDNTKTAPDENYARELQELFTIGKFLTNHYTEDDVKAAAKVLTGWRNNRSGISSYFDLTRHDTSNKQFSSFYNNTVIQGRNSSTAGNDELDDLLAMIFAHDEVAKFICRKLYRYFIYYVIDDTTESLVITPLAQIFRESGYNIKTVVKALLKSEHFFDPLNRACMIKQPVDFLAAAARNMNLIFPDNSQLQAQYNHWLYAEQMALAAGQDLGDPPNVAGWPAFYADPQFYEIWINADTLPKRNLVTDNLCYNGYNRNGFKLAFDMVSFASQFTDPSDPNKLISEVCKLIYAIPISQTSMNSVKTSFLLSGQASDSYWTSAWSAYANNPSDTNAKNTVNTRLQAMMKYLLDLAEYQLI